jgi:hypothetical protein
MPSVDTAHADLRRPGPTLLSPSGGFAQKLKIEDKIDELISVKIQ